MRTPNKVPIREQCSSICMTNWIDDSSTMHPSPLIRRIRAPRVERDQRIIGSNRQRRLRGLDRSRVPHGELRQRDGTSPASSSAEHAQPFGIGPAVSWTWGAEPGMDLQPATRCCSGSEFAEIADVEPNRVSRNPSRCGAIQMMATRGRNG
jgi:hypothetical protein